MGDSQESGSRPIWGVIRKLTEGLVESGGRRVAFWEWLLFTVSAYVCVVVWRGLKAFGILSENIEIHLSRLRVGKSHDYKEGVLKPWYMLSPGYLCHSSAWQDTLAACRKCATKVATCNIILTILLARGYYKPVLVRKKLRLQEGPAVCWLYQWGDPTPGRPDSTWRLLSTEQMPTSADWKWGKNRQRWVSCSIPRAGLVQEKLIT